MEGRSGAVFRRSKKAPFNELPNGVAPDQEARPASGILDEWLQDMPIRLERLKYLLPELELDRSRQSLCDIEGVVLQRYAGISDVYTEADLERVELLVRYLGESYRSIAGGTWEFAEVDGAPPRFLLQPDVPVAEPVNPLGLIVMAADRRSGDVFTQFHDELRDAAQRRAREEPGWTPRRIRIPGLDLPENVQTPELIAWLQDMDATLRQWGTRYDAGGPWDYSLQSLDRLEQLIRTEVHLEPKGVGGDRFLIDGAVRYVGETLLRHGGGEWVYRPGTPENNYFRGRPYVSREDGRGEALFVIPIVQIRQLLRKGPELTLHSAVTEDYLP